MAIIKEFKIIPDNADMFAGRVGAHSSTFFNIEDTNSITRLTGVGFTYDAQGLLTGGRVTGISWKLGGELALSITGLKASVVELGSSHLPEAVLFRFNDVFYGFSGGKDEIFLATGNDIFYGYGGDDSCQGGYGTDYLYGGDGNDTLKGDDALDFIRGDDGNDTIYGGEGSDLITGGRGADKMFGGFGADRFDFNFVGEIGKGTSRDIIFDFDTSDVIDLSTIDANGSAAGAGRFNPIGDAKFSHTAGELRFAKGVLSGDVNGDAVADFEIRVVGLTYSPDVIL